MHSSMLNLILLLLLQGEGIQARNMRRKMQFAAAETYNAEKPRRAMGGLSAIRGRMHHVAEIQSPIYGKKGGKKGFQNMQPPPNDNHGHGMGGNMIPHHDHDHIDDLSHDSKPHHDHDHSDDVSHDSEDKIGQQHHHHSHLHSSTESEADDDSFDDEESSDEESSDEESSDEESSDEDSADKESPDDDSSNDKFLGERLVLQITGTAVEMSVDVDFYDMPLSCFTDLDVYDYATGVYLGEAMYCIDIAAVPESEPQAFIAPFSSLSIGFLGDIGEVMLSAQVNWLPSLIGNKGYNYISSGISESNAILDGTGTFKDTHGYFRQNGHELISEMSDGSIMVQFNDIIVLDYYKFNIVNQEPMI